MFTLKIICLFLGILFTGVNIQRTLLKSGVPTMNNIVWALAVGGFIYLHWFV